MPLRPKEYKGIRASFFQEDGSDYINPGETLSRTTNLYNCASVKVICVEGYSYR